MRSIILTTTTKLILPLMLIFSFVLLLRGHNEPGGGFIGGLVAAAAFALYAIANNVEEAKKLLKTDPLNLIKTGLFLALISALIPVIVGKNFFTGMWIEEKIPVIGKLGTPLLFDIGVYVLVLGIITKIIFSLFEEDRR